MTVVQDRRRLPRRQKSAFRAGTPSHVGDAPVLREPLPADARPRVAGKFLSAGGRKLYLRGVAYGPFMPEMDGCEYHTPEEVERDFTAMAASGINMVRVYTVPPRWLLDCAQRHGLYVMVGLPWEQHIAFLDDSRATSGIERAVRSGIEQCAGHPAVLCFAVGNEIPAQIVRWHGARKIERFIRRLYDIAKGIDPECLVTYVNYPTTEYLNLTFLDFQCVNVYLETREKLSAYLARLQSIAGNQPLVIGELGLDSCRNGEEQQGATLEWQIRLAFECGVAGVCVFSWTDEWYRGGAEILDWGFGLTDRSRRPKAALASVRRAFREVPFRADVQWPMVSVVVCTYNGARTVTETCDALVALEYPNYEVIVVSDGSTDDTMEIVTKYAFRVVHTRNGGLSRARNVGLEAAKGEIVAYIDDDAHPDPHWLQYLAWTYMHSRHSGVGGPNIPPLDDPFVAQCVAHSPGGPNHVMLNDTLAEHIPGCNMSFRRDALMAVNGFDPLFRIAGDDVDLCWRILDAGHTIGFSPAAMVWHRRRASVKQYLRQQYNYGRAEAMLFKKWPARYNSVGHVSWAGRIYGAGSPLPFMATKRIYHGTWGLAPFQSIYERASIASVLPLMPEWHLLVMAAAVLALAGVVWEPLSAALLLLLPAVALTVSYAVTSADSAPLGQVCSSPWKRARARLLIGALHILQPLSRLRGRIALGLQPWRSRLRALSFAGFREHRSWHEDWLSPDERIRGVERVLASLGARMRRGGDYDGWDLQLAGGPLGGARLRVVVEEHGGGRQFLRAKAAPFATKLATAIAGVVAIALVAAVAAGGGVAIVMGVVAAVFALRVWGEAAGAAVLARSALREAPETSDPRE